MSVAAIRLTRIIYWNRFIFSSTIKLSYIHIILQLLSHYCIKIFKITKYMKKLCVPPVVHNVNNTKIYYSNTQRFTWPFQSFFGHKNWLYQISILPVA